jgi:hypothetical protein
VLTAAHCVFDIHTTRRMVSALNFSPGMNGNGHPFGIAQWQNVRILQQFSSEVPPGPEPQISYPTSFGIVQWQSLQLFLSKVPPDPKPCTGHCLSDPNDLVAQHVDSQCAGSCDNGTPVYTVAINHDTALIAPALPAAVLMCKSLRTSLRRWRIRPLRSSTAWS